jgi:uncharacterized spore protein YtfJ
MDVSKIITALLTGMKEISVSETVVGAPIRSAGSTIIPVNKVTLGFGTGAAGTRNGAHANASGLESTAVGGGLTVDPQAFIVVNSDGHAQMLSLKDSRGATVLRAFELLPGVLGQLGLPIGEAARAAPAVLPAEAPAPATKGEGPAR